MKFPGVKIIVRASESRSSNVALLKQSIPDLIESWDLVGVGCGRAMVNACRIAGEGPAVHLEDDIVLCDRFLDKLHSAIAARPYAAINFFSRRKDDLTIGSRWSDRYDYLQCTYLPSHLSAAVVDLAESQIARGEVVDYADVLVAKVLKARKLSHWIHVPNLVDHLRYRSTVNPLRGCGRQSKSFHLNVK